MKIDMTIEHLYGIHSAELTLTEKAEAAYEACDPMWIIEKKLPDGTLLYDIRPDWKNDLTADEVNEYLEDLADSIFEEDHTGEVQTESGEWIDFSAAVNMMDDELRERLHLEMVPCSEQEFYDAYVKAHAEKFNGEQFTI